MPELLRLRALWEWTHRIVERCHILLKPDHLGTRIAALDGAGIRGWHPARVGEAA